MKGIRHGGFAAFLVVALLLLAACGGSGASNTTTTESGSSSGGSASSSGGSASSGGNGPGAGIPEGPVKIGIQAPLSRDYALEGQGFVNAVQLLADQLNAQGGIDGHKVEIMAEDDQGVAQQASVAAQRLVSQGVVAVVGGYNSTATEAAQPVYDENHVIQVTPASTAVGLSQKGYKYFFRTATLDSSQGAFAADLMVNQLGKKNIAILHDNSTYGAGLAEETRSAVEKLSGKVVFYDAITPGGNDFGAVLTKLKGAKPDVVYFTGYFSDAGLLLRQAKDLGIDATWIGGDANNNPQVVDVAGAAAEGFMVTTPPQPQDLDTPEAQQFVQDYQKKYGELPPSIWTISAADAFRVIVEAIRQAGSTDPDAIASALHGLKDFPGFSGPITFAENGDREGSLHVAYVIKDRKFVRYDANK